ncbi:MAG: bifunctional demethylmenaquinone methyltransferase/2-methoxy-6-polyprenyl-1,4-benzoquinol methylase UbiE [Candidatus Methylomirabilales bacterium]
MSAPVPPDAAAHTAAIRRMFGAIAPRYDFLNRLLSFRRDVAWRRAAAAEAGLPSQGAALDLCTGTADLALEVARQHPGARMFVGVDLCEPMLRLGRRKVAGREHRVRLAAGAAEALPLKAETFDAVLVAFGIRNVTDRATALAEMRRILRPGGRAIVLEFFQPRGTLFAALYRFYSQALLPRIGGWISGNAEAYAYLPASVEAFPEPAAFAEALRAAGFGGVRWRALTGGIVCIHVGVRDRGK